MAGRQGLRFAFVLILARLVGPEEFGVVAQALIVVTFLTLLLDQGLGATLVQRSTLESAHIGAIFSLNLVTTLALTLATIATAPLVADFFHTPDLTEVLRALSVTVLFLGIGVVPRAVLSRAMRFRPLALAEVGASVVGGVAGTAVAVAGGGYWALVVHVVVTDACAAVAMFAATGRLPLRSTRSAMAEIWGFSSRVLAFSLVNYLTRNLDNVLVGRYLGATPLAFYSLSYRTLMVPVVMLSQVANRVALPIYSRAQDDVPRLRATYFRNTRLIALVAFPLMALVVVLAPLGVPLVFGDDWRPAVVPMQILALTGARQAVQSTLGPILLAAGRADWQLRWGLGTMLVYIPAFVIGLQWDVTGVAAAYTIAGFLVAPIAVRMVGALLEFRIAAYAATVVPALVATLGGALGAAAVAEAVHGAWGQPVAAVVAAPVVGAAIYAGLLASLWRDDVTELAAFLRRALRARGA